MFSALVNFKILNEFYTHFPNLLACDVPVLTIHSHSLFLSVFVSHKFYMCMVWYGVMRYFLVEWK